MARQAKKKLAELLPRKVYTFILTTVDVQFYLALLELFFSLDDFLVTKWMG